MADRMPMPVVEFIRAEHQIDKLEHGVRFGASSRDALLLEC